MKKGAKEIVFIAQDSYRFSPISAAETIRATLKGAEGDLRRWGKPGQLLKVTIERVK